MYEDEEEEVKKIVAANLHDMFTWYILERKCE